MGSSTKMKVVQKNSWFSLFLWPAFRRLFLLDDNLWQELLASLDPGSRATLGNPPTPRHFRFDPSRNHERPDPPRCGDRLKELTCKKQII
jgi:hypothetical protein